MKLFPNDLLFIKRLPSDHYGFPFRSQTCHTAREQRANMIYHSKLCAAVPRSLLPSALHTSLCISLACSISLLTQRFVFYCLDHHSRTQLLCSSSSSSSCSSPSSSSSSSSHVQMVVQSVIPAGCSNSNFLSNSYSDTDSASASGGRSPSSPPPRVAANANADVYLAWQFSLVFSYYYYYMLSLSLSLSFLYAAVIQARAAHHRLLHSVLPP